MKFVSAILASALFPVHLLAAPLAFDDKATFMASGTSVTTQTETLEGLFAGNLSAGTNNTGLFDTVLEAASSVSTIGPAKFGDFTSQVMTVYMRETFVRFENFSTPTEVVGFGFDVDLLNADGLIITVQSAGTTFDFTPSSQPFIGAIDDNGIESITMWSTREYLELDNFVIMSRAVSVTPPPGVPLPAPALMLTSALALLGARRWMKRA